jgi:hypothetical protein
VHIQKDITHLPCIETSVTTLVQVEKLLIAITAQRQVTLPQVPMRHFKDYKYTNNCPHNHHPNKKSPHFFCADYKIKKIPSPLLLIPAHNHYGLSAPLGAIPNI